ncbi:CBS domain-containing protein [Jiangella asiatica]|uniref:CBS domain-containing protein n=2 Tax=Jiangella asiatica TaxID=2530372 RepID=A0A4R5CML3_9ACTN|nr:CBS domain-containing protein [Jiangella asiatica]
MAATSVGDVMTREIIGVSPTAPVLEAARAMRDHHIGDVLVLDDGALRGVVTDRDLAVRVIAEGIDPETTLAAHVASADPVVITRPQASVAEAVQLMRERAVRRLPVVDDGRAVGVVSLGDLAQVRRPDSALAEISAGDPNL